MRAMDKVAHPAPTPAERRPDRFLFAKRSVGKPPRPALGTPAQASGIRPFRTNLPRSSKSGTLMPSAGVSAFATSTPRSRTVRSTMAPRRIRTALRLPVALPKIDAFVRWSECVPSSLFRPSIAVALASAERGCCRVPRCIARWWVRLGKGAVVRKATSPRPECARASAAQ